MQEYNLRECFTFTSSSPYLLFPAETERNTIRDQTPRSLQAVVQGTQNGSITTAGHINDAVTDYLSPHGAQGLVSQQLSPWVADNWSSLKSKISSTSERDAMEFLGDCLKKVAWWAVLIAVVGAIVLTSLYVGKLLAVAMGGAAIGTGAVAAGAAGGAALAGPAIAMGTMFPPVAIAAGVGIGLWGLFSSSSGGRSRRPGRRRR